MSYIFLNDQPYVMQEEDPRESLRTALAFAVDDWSSSRAMAWVYGIVLGWDDEAMAELAQKFRWDAATTARLNRLHAQFEDDGERDSAQEAPKRVP